MQVPGCTSEGKLMQGPNGSNTVPKNELTEKQLLPTADITDILRLISRAEPIDVLLQKVVTTAAKNFGIKRMVLCLLDERTGVFSPKVVHGFPIDKVLAIKRHTYTLDRKQGELKDNMLVGRGTYYVRAEDRAWGANDDLDYILDPVSITKPRQDATDWHNLDSMVHVMTDRLGNWIGWIEINEPAGGKVPSSDVIERIQLLADLTGIAIENSKMFEEAVQAMTESQAYLDLIIHDIGNMVNPMIYYLDAVQESTTLDSRNHDCIKKAASVATAAKSLIDNVRKLSEVRSSEFVPKERMDLREVLVRGISAVKRDFPAKDIIVSLDCPDKECVVVADDLINDLFINILHNAVKYNHSSAADVEVAVTDSHDVWTVKIADHGIGISDERKPKVFSRFSKRPEGVAGTGLGLSIVASLVERYNGIIHVRDRVPGSSAEGACFEVAFPKAQSNEQTNGQGQMGTAVVDAHDHW